MSEPASIRVGNWKQSVGGDLQERRLTLEVQARGVYLQLNLTPATARQLRRDLKDAIHWKEEA